MTEDTYIICIFVEGNSLHTRKKLCGKATIKFMKIVTVNGMLILKTCLKRKKVRIG